MVFISIFYLFLLLRQEKQLGFMAVLTAVLLSKEVPYLQVLKHGNNNSNNGKTMQNA